jgi:hypothetical protein
MSNKRYTKQYFVNHPVFRIVAPVIYGVLIYLLVLMINNTVAQVNELFRSEEVYVFIVLTFIAFESSRFIIKLLAKYTHYDASRFYITVQVLTTKHI